MTRGYSGKHVDEVSVEAIRRGEVSTDDVRIHPETLEHQARVAEDHGNPQLALNFRRAAELTHLSEAEIMRLYESLRPHRSTAGELREIAEDLRARGAKLNAALFVEAADIYERRGLLRK
jgi:propanediol dehydratase small subunit